MVRAGTGGIHKWCRHYAYGQVARAERAPRALPCETLGHRQRALGRLSDGLHGTPAVRAEVRDVRQGDEKGRSNGHADCAGRDARCHGRSGPVTAHKRKYVPDYLSSADWTGQMILCCLNNIDMISEHYYASGTMHTNIKLEKKVPINPPLSFIEFQRAAAVQVRAKYEHYEQYLKLIPALKAKPVPIAIDEWAYFSGDRNSYKTVPAYAWAFHEMFRHSDVFKMAALTFATATLTSNRTEAVLNPTGLLFKMYRDHFGRIPVEVTGNSPQPKPVFPAGGDQPAVNPGSDTYPLDVSAALSEDRRTLT